MPVRHIWIVLALLLAPLHVLAADSMSAPANAAGVGTNPPAPSGLTASGCGSPEIAVKDIRDPASPYAGQYAGWDLWLYDRAVSLSPEQQAAECTQPVPEDWYSYWVYVDLQGYPIPYLTSCREAYEANLPMSAKPAAKCTPHFTVEGRLPLYAEMEHAQYLLRASYMPALPDWLAAAPPIAANLLPDGSIATLGPLGSDDGEGAWVKLEPGTGWQERSSAWYLYGPDGKLLAQTEANGWREDLFRPQATSKDPLLALGRPRWISRLFAEARLHGWDSGYSVERGYLLLTSDHHKTIEAVYNYDGTPMPRDYNIWGRDGNYLTELEGAEIRKLYAAQQELLLAAANQGGSN